MAYQVGDECYPDMTTALDAFAAAKTGQVYTSGTNVFSITAARSGTTGVLFTGTKIAGTGSNWTYTQAMSFPTCQKLTAADGAVVGWLIFAVFAAAFAVRMLRRGL